MEDALTVELRELPVGKVPPHLLAQLIRFQGWPDRQVVLGPHLGEDAAVIDIGDRYLVAKTDPITFVTDDIGWYLVQVNANDLATSGAAPRWLLVTLLLPEHGATPELAQRIVSQIDAACRQLRVAVVGGHTEVTYGLDRPLAIGHMLGVVAKDKWVATAGARVGDDLVLVKGIAIEGTSIIAREKVQELSQRGYSEEFIKRAQQYLYDPGISVVAEALLAVDSAEIHAMHDPTEGGVATALHELARAAGVGLWVDAEAIPILPECKALCSEFSLDPLGLIASGALLVALAHQDTPALLSAYEEANIACSRIGYVTPVGTGVKLKSGASTIDLPCFDQDELAGLL